MAEASSDISPGTSSNIHKFNVIQPPPNDSGFPRPRSGHRTFVDNDYLYVIGGFTDVPIDNIMRELWKFNLVTHTWTQCTIPDDTFPTTLASFACHSTGNGTFMVYGGTGIPFGRDLDEIVYMGRIDGNNVQIEEIKPLGNKLGCYGHVLVFDPSRNKIFSIGGTDGTQFKLDVHALSRNEEGKWEWEEYAVLADDVGLYRMEAILDKDNIFIFGGGTTHRISNFNTIHVFNIERREYEIMETEPDPANGYPTGRRCHSLVQWGRQVIIAGGCFDDSRTVLGCVWSFNLDTHTWRKMNDLPFPVYFHDASITSEGQMLIFGGVSNAQPRGRTAALQTLWLGPPTLFSTALAKMMKKVELKGNEHVLSDRLNLTRHIYSEVILPA